MINKETMETTFFNFIGMNLKVTRPVSISHRDKDIGNRAFEILRGDKADDEWTKEVDSIIKKHSITFAKVSGTEMYEIKHKSTDVTVRI